MTTSPAVAETVLDAPANTPPFLQPAPPPGWTSSEFISTMAVHLINLLAVLLDLLHVDWSKGLSSVQGIIPVVALTISALLQAAYSNHRTKLKIAHVAETAAVKLEQVKAVATTVLPAVEPLLLSASEIIADPVVSQRLTSIEQALEKLTAAWSAPTTIINNTGQDVTTIPVPVQPAQPDLVPADPTVPVAPVVPGDQLTDPSPSCQGQASSAGDPTTTPDDPTAGGLYLVGDEATGAQQAS